MLIMHDIISCIIIIIRIIIIIIIRIIIIILKIYLDTLSREETLFKGVYRWWYLAHVNGAYLRHVKFCIISPICQRGPLPTLTVPGWSKVHGGDVEGVEQTCRGTPASPILV